MTWLVTKLRTRASLLERERGEGTDVKYLREAAEEIERLRVTLQWYRCAGDQEKAVDSGDRAHRALAADGEKP